MCGHCGLAMRLCTTPASQFSPTCITAGGCSSLSSYPSGRGSGSRKTTWGSLPAAASLVNCVEGDSVLRRSCESSWSEEEVDGRQRPVGSRPQETPFGVQRVEHGGAACGVGNVRRRRLAPRRPRVEVLAIRPCRTRHRSEVAVSDREVGRRPVHERQIVLRVVGHRARAAQKARRPEHRVLVRAVVGDGEAVHLAVVDLLVRAVPAVVGVGEAEGRRGAAVVAPLRAAVLASVRAQAAVRERSGARPRPGWRPSAPRRRPSTPGWRRSWK